SEPAVSIESSVGATVVARVKTISASDPRGANIAIYDDLISTVLNWGGPDGVIREINRDAFVVVAGDDQYHYIRCTVRTTGVEDAVVVKVYFDEQPVPVLTITHAPRVGSEVGLDAFGFGAGFTAGAQEIWFDCFYATNAGAFAPGEEDDCLGR